MAQATTVEQNPDHEAHVHVMPPRVLLTTWIALLILTFLTVAATYVDLGTANIWIALLIATAKATIVALYFMHLRYDSPFHGLVLAAALLFVAVFIGVALLDTAEYQPDFDVPAGVTVTPTP